MRPYHHSRASASRYGGDWTDYLDLHAFLDSSKVAHADLRHRMILHSVDLGAELAKRLYGRDVQNIVADHVQEDVGRPVGLETWLRFCDPRHMPKIRGRLSRSGFVDLEIKRSKIERPDLIEKVFDLFTLPSRFAGDHRSIALSILGNSFGIELIGRILGGPVELDGKIYDPAWAAEHLVYRLFKTIPDVRSSTLGLNMDDFMRFLEK